MSQRAHGDDDRNGVRRLAWEHLDLDGRVDSLGDKVDALQFDQRKMIIRIAENTAMVQALDVRVEVLATDAMRELGAISRQLAAVADDNAAARKRQDSITDEHEADITGVRAAVVTLGKTDAELHEQVQAARKLARIKWGVSVGLACAASVATWEAAKFLLPLLH